jgi:hypothetical protein
MAFMTQHCVGHSEVIERPPVTPEFRRHVTLVTVRGWPHSPRSRHLLLGHASAFGPHPTLAVQAVQAREISRPMRLVFEGDRALRVC